LVLAIILPPLLANFHFALPILNPFNLLNNYFISAVAFIVLLILRFLKIPISLPIIIFLALLFVIAVLVMHRLVIPALHKKVNTGSEGMIGLEGKVIKPLVPEGAIRVSGEYWKARSDDENITVGEQVEILGLDGLTLKVKRKVR
jgi:membrane protein implicated in regulation of membrane protease activity